MACPVLHTQGSQSNANYFEGFDIWTLGDEEIGKQACSQEEEGNHRQAERLHTAWLSLLAECRDKQ